MSNIVIEIPTHLIYDPYKMRPNDPAYSMLHDGIETIPVVYRRDCFICNDPEFAQMGLPLCRKCPVCHGHIPADNCVCDDCGFDEQLDAEYREANEV